VGLRGTTRGAIELEEDFFTAALRAETLETVNSKVL
jgi:hypothetical protein